MDKEAVGNHAVKPLPSKEYLHSRLIYNQDTGSLVWKERNLGDFSGKFADRSCRAWNKRFPGKAALTQVHVKDGYMVGRLDGRPVKAHRIIWMMIHGSDPGVIDHIDGNPRNNRMDNLRSVSHQENLRNQAVNRTNKSGVMGVFGRYGKWRAYITFDQKRISLGCFTDKDDAIRARKEAERDLGFHENHGRPAHA